MKKTIFLIFLSVIFSSCNLADKLEQMQKMNDDLEQHFEHNHINMVIGFGTDDEDNNVEVTFYEYDLSSTEYQELKKISERVANRLNSKYPGLRKKSYIEVRFTEEIKSDNNNSFVNFKHNN